MKRDFLQITDFSSDEIREIFRLTAEVKKDTKMGKEYTPLKGKIMAMIFAKPSARTRVSFETGMMQLGGQAIYLGPTDIGLGTREVTRDVARVISRYNDLIMARLFKHADLLELAEFATVPVINGLTDLNHPCQVLSDIYTIWEHRKHLDNLKVAFIGDSNNVANSWLNLATRLPMHFVLATPADYQPDAGILKRARNSDVSRIEIVHDPREAVQSADVIYTDVWASMGQEAELAKRRSDFDAFQVNAELLKQAPRDVYIMHCLPAHRGDEITDEVIDGPNSIVFDQAENRLHVQKAIIVKLMQN
jgi:ornithine carbamoyltransferase